MNTFVLLSLEAVAQRLLVSVKTVRRRIDTGSLRAIREGGRKRVLEQDLEDYLRRISQTTIILK